MNILVVDDEKEIADVVELYLQNDQYKVFKFYNGQDALDCINSTKIDLAILDIMLPDGSGTEILKRIKERSPGKPVILISARGDSIDRVLGFEMGCNDYLPKPFLPMELCYRVSNLLHDHKQSVQCSTVVFSCYKLNKTERSIYDKNGDKIEMTSKEYDIVLYFLTHPSAAISRDQLLNEIWGRDYYGYYRVIDNHIKNIRKKIPEIHLETIYGYGYRYNL